jgi:hypothetical protein
MKKILFLLLFTATLFSCTDSTFDKSVNEKLDLIIKNQESCAKDYLDPIAQKTGYLQEPCGDFPTKNRLILEDEITSRGMKIPKYKIGSGEPERVYTCLKVLFQNAKH